LQNAMSDLRERTLAFLAESNKPVSVRELVRRLGLGGSERRELKGVIRGLLAEGLVVNIRGARIGLPARMSLAIGRLTCAAAGHGFVVPEAPKTPPGPSAAVKGRGSIRIEAPDLRDALHGDRVVVRVERQTAKGLSGRIVRVLERATLRIVGRYEDDGRYGGHAVPFDRRMLHELYIPAGESAGAQSGEMVTVEMTRPPSAKRSPVGRVTEVLGRIEDRGVDLKVIVAKYGLPLAFPVEVEQEAARAPRVVTPEEAVGRRDFRSALTVTIDPEQARDHDDAFSLERTARGWRLAVHIADVAHYIPEGGALDQEAYLRGTSVYFPECVVPMLPHALSSGICSLVQGEDRLTQTVVLDYDRQGRVEAVDFVDGIIRARALLSYGEAQRIIDGDAELRARHADVVSMLLEADDLAHLLRALREERGSLDFDLPEPALTLGDSGEVVAIAATERLDSMRLIEEFALAANGAVAERLSQADIATLYRVHEPPDPERVEEFRAIASSFGYRLPGVKEEVRPEDFQRVTRESVGRPEEKLIGFLLLRTLKLARYHEENLGHFGLATDRYLHFTSPIRRYPDLVVHRALRAMRRGELAAHDERWRAALGEIGQHLSEMERRATEAERELVEWKKVRFMGDKLGETFSGFITGVQPFGLFIELTDIYVQGLVHVSSMRDDYYHFSDRAHTLQGESTRRIYRLGDRVGVRLARVDLARRQLDFELLDAIRSGAPESARRKPRQARKARS
jgi:ribonuclease R